MPRRKSPFLAGILSIIPGLGQLYNEQFVKGFGILFGLGVGFLVMVILPALDFVGIGGTGPFPSGSPFAHGFDPFSIAGNGNVFLPIAYFLVIAPIVWLYSLFDAIFTARRMNDENGFNHAVPRYAPVAPMTAQGSAAGAPTAGVPTDGAPVDGGPVAGGTPVTAGGLSVPVSVHAHTHLHRTRHDPGLTQREAVIWGIGLVALGLLGLAATFDGVLWTAVSRGWPLLLVIGGAYFVWSETNRQRARTQVGASDGGSGDANGTGSRNGDSSGKEAGK